MSSSAHSSILLPKSQLTASMSDSARPIEPKPFPYQPSKQQKEGEDEYVVIEASPSDPRFSHETVHVQVSKADAAYNLQPIHCGRQVVFLNAQNVDFYLRELKSPNLSVWILCGLTVGQSHALKRLFESGWRQNIQVAIMEINKFELVCSKDGLENILYEGKAVELPDCILNRVGASVSYFGLAVIRQLENMGCLLLNTLKSIEISRDKMLTVQHLAAHGLPIPKTILAKFPMNLQTLSREFEYPIIIKKVSGSQGKGIIKVDSHQQLEDLVDMLDTGKPLIFQEFISASSGRDLRVFVIGGRVVGAMMRIAAKGQFKANVHQGGSVKPVKISPQVEWLVLECVKIIGLDIAGVDLLIDKVGADPHSHTITHAPKRKHTDITSYIQPVTKRTGTFSLPTSLSLHDKQSVHSSLWVRPHTAVCRLKHGSLMMLLTALYMSYVSVKNTYKICEVNSSPGFEGLEKALGENIAIKMFLYMKMRLGVWRRGGKLNRGITVPVGEDDEVPNSAMAPGGAAAGGGGGGGDREQREGEEKEEREQQRVGGVNGSAASGVNAVSVDGLKDERDRFRTMPRNRSMKRTSGGQ